MSKPEVDDQGAHRVALHGLETAVGDLLTRVAELREQATTAEARGGELEEVVRRFTHEDGDANLVLTRLRTLEEENADFRARLEKGREGVERLLARVRFLEGQR